MEGELNVAQSQWFLTHGLFVGLWKPEVHLDSTSLQIL